MPGVTDIEQEAEAGVHFDELNTAFVSGRQIIGACLFLLTCFIIYFLWTKAKSRRNEQIEIEHLHSPSHCEGGFLSSDKGLDPVLQIQIVVNRISSGELTSSDVSKKSVSSFNYPSYETGGDDASEKRENRIAFEKHLNSEV